ncbi:MAG: DUF1801 domain-containing protein [Planctomycetes bacterium]|nr:DUF1801 domain-containing protein [Planctomycetota bacterium]
MQSKAKTVREYLASLPSDRRETLEAVLTVIRQNLDAGYEEHMQYGMIGWSVPHRLFPPGYHCDPRQPLGFAGLASQKQHMSLYLMGIYFDSKDDLSTWFRTAWAKTGKRLDMGKCCVRFRKLDDVALDVVGEAVRRMPVDAYVGRYVQLLAESGRGPDGKKLGTGKAKAAATARKPAPAAKAKAPARKAAKKAGKTTRK